MKKKSGLITKTSDNIDIKLPKIILSSIVTIDYNIENPKIEAPIK